MEQDKRASLSQEVSHCFAQARKYAASADKGFLVKPALEFMGQNIVDIPGDPIRDVLKMEPRAFVREVCELSRTGALAEMAYQASELYKMASRTYPQDTERAALALERHKAASEMAQDPSVAKALNISEAQLLRLLGLETDPAPVRSTPQQETGQRAAGRALS